MVIVGQLLHADTQQSAGDGSNCHTGDEETRGNLGEQRGENNKITLQRHPQNILSSDWTEGILSNNDAKNNVHMHYQPNEVHYVLV